MRLVGERGRIPLRQHVRVQPAIRLFATSRAPALRAPTPAALRTDCGTSTACSVDFDCCTMRAANSSPARPSGESSTTAMTRSSGRSCPWMTTPTFTGATRQTVEHFFDDAAQQIAAEHRAMVSEQQPADRGCVSRSRMSRGRVVGPNGLRIDPLSGHARVLDRLRQHRRPRRVFAINLAQARNECRPPVAARAPRRAAAGRIGRVAAEARLGATRAPSGFDTGTKMPPPVVAGRSCPLGATGCS